MKISIPAELKKWLVDDWDFVTRQKQVESTLGLVLVWGQDDPHSQAVRPGNEARAETRCSSAVWNYQIQQTVWPEVFCAFIISLSVLQSHCMAKFERHSSGMGTFSFVIAQLVRLPKKVTVNDILEKYKDSVSATEPEKSK